MQDIRGFDIREYQVFVAAYNEYTRRRKAAMRRKK